MTADGETAIRQAINELITRGERAYRNTVPDLAAELLGQKRGTTMVQEQREIAFSALEMSNRGDLAGYDTPEDDWRVKPPAD